MTATDPWIVLGLEPTASDDEIRTRYRDLVKQHPPELDPAGFQAIRTAYEQVRNPHVRARTRLFGPAPLDDLDELRAVLAGWRRPPAGPELWLEALGE